MGLNNIDKVNIFHFLVLHFEYTGKSHRNPSPNPVQLYVIIIPIRYSYTVMTINITLKFFVFSLPNCSNVSILKRTNIFDYAIGGSAVTFLLNNSYRFVHLRAIYYLFVLIPVKSVLPSHRCACSRNSNNNNCSL